MRRLAQRHQRRLRFRDEASQHRCRLAAEDRFLLALHARQPRLVARRDAGDEARTEHLLHLGEAAEAERMGETDDGRRRHAGALRDLRDRAERDVGRMIEHELGDLLQAAGQCAMPLGDRAAQFVVAHRRAGRLVHGRQLYPIAAVSPFRSIWFKYSTLHVIIECSFYGPQQENKTVGRGSDDEA